MAKISARGAYKIAQASKLHTDEDGWQHKHRIALRSDGAILHAHDLLSPERASFGTRGWHRGSYSILAKLAPTTDTLAAFAGYAAASGYDQPVVSL